MKGVVKWMNGHGHTMIGWDTDLKDGTTYVEGDVDYKTADAVHAFLREQVEQHRMIADPVRHEVLAKPGKRVNVDLSTVEELIVLPQMAGGSNE